MLHLRYGTCLFALAASLSASPGFADTSITTDTTTPLATSGAGNVSITSDGSVTVASGAVITVDSNNSVANAGDIDAGSANGATAIAIMPGTNSAISNSGAIRVTENFSAGDVDANSIADGPIASASNRYGIRVLGGGTASGTIDNSGTIYVEGLNSGGIVLDSAYTGSLTNSGSINVIGDYSYGIKLQDISGNVTISKGNVTAIGEGAIALSAQGDIGGTLTIQGSVGQSTSYGDDSGKTLSLSRSDLRSGAPAVEVLGNVSGGIIVAIPPTDKDTTDTDEDDDGVTDSSEGTGSITAYGNGPALRIGSADNIVIGSLPAANGSYSILLNGNVTSTAAYSATDSYGLVLGGQGGTVSLPGGVAVNGILSASTYDSNATALLINSGVTLNHLYVGGTIKAAVTSPGEAELYAIRDLSGTLTTIDNTGYIVVSGSSEDLRQAINLSSNTTGVVINQYLSAADIATKADIAEDLEDGETDTTVYASITGDIVTGVGNDIINASTGFISGNTYFNAGNDQLILSGDAGYYGTVNYGTGTGTLTMGGSSTFSGKVDAANQALLISLADSSTFTGAITNGAVTDVTVNGGAFYANVDTVSHFRTLNVGANGTYSVYIDGDEGTSSLVDVDTASFAAGSRVGASITSLANAEGSYVILTADQLTGAPTFSTEFPLLFTGGVSVSGNNLVLDIKRKTAAELGLSSAASSAYDAIIDVAIDDDQMSSNFLQIDDVATLESQIDQLLPDHAGGIFDFATRTSRLSSRHLMDDSSMFEISDVWGWLEPIYWRSSKDKSGTVAYDAHAIGVTGGMERFTPIGYVGLSYTYSDGKIKNNGGTSVIDASQHELGASWRLDKHELYAFARVTGSMLSLSSSRTFTGTVDDVDFTRTSLADWKGWTVSGTAGLSYDFRAGSNLVIKPMAVLDYYRLHENGYEESGGDEAVDLIVGDRTSDALSATTTLTASYRMGQQQSGSRPLTLELEGGRRTVLGGMLGTTIAKYADSDSYEIMADQMKDGYLGEVRLLAGGMDFTWQLSGRAEQTWGGADYSGRITFSAAF